MNQYVTAAVIKNLRESKKMTQAELAEKLCVSDKAISKWETGRGYPDICLLEALAKALGVSVLELFSGKIAVNKNKSANLLRSKLYVCPMCGNVIQSTGEAVISCCGIELPPLEAEDADEMHGTKIEKIEDEFFVTVSHDMTKTHFISFIIAIRDNSCEIQKLYPEQSAQARFKIDRTEAIYFYCNRHGLFKAK